jgi:hypothetical protein
MLIAACMPLKMKYSKILVPIVKLIQYANKLDTPHTQEYWIFFVHYSIKYGW